MPRSLTWEVDPMMALAPAMSVSPVPTAVLVAFFFQDFTLSGDREVPVWPVLSVVGRQTSFPLPCFSLSGWLRGRGKDPAVEAPGLRKQLPTPEDCDN